MTRILPQTQSPSRSGPDGCCATLTGSASAALGHHEIKGNDQIKGMPKPKVRKILDSATRSRRFDCSMYQIQWNLLSHQQFPTRLCVDGDVGVQSAGDNVATDNRRYPCEGDIETTSFRW